MARFLGVSTAGYYKYLKRGVVSSRHADDEALRKQVVSIHTESRGCYGVDRIEKMLIRKGIHVHRRRILRVMKAAEIRGKSSLRRARTTNSEHDFPVSPNLLKRNFYADSINRVWVSDITYLRTREGWLYLCVILDLFSRRVVGWAASTSLDASLVIQAFRMATFLRRPAKGLIFHSDRGVQYASAAFRKELGIWQMKQSMSGKGQCLDNAVAESFFGTLKMELEANYFWSQKEAVRDVFDYIECFYNRVRIHSSLEFSSPDEFENTDSAA